MTTEHLRFAPDILRRLGEELVPHADQGIIELVRNSYDADAGTCRVELIGTERPGGLLRVTDDGVAMSPDALRNGWLVLGRSGKVERLPTRKGRLPVRDKGLGRLAALRMGSAASLRSRPQSDPGREYCLDFDWSCFDAADVVESVPLVIRSGVTSEPPGTTIEVSNLGMIQIRRRIG
jgi:hypothetical protein